MPLTGKDTKVLRNFESEYGPEEGKRNFYASINSGRVTGIPEAKRMKSKQKRARARTRVKGKRLMRRTRRRPRRK